MGFNICPVEVVAAPVESVWESLSDLTLYDEWGMPPLSASSRKEKPRPGR